MSNFVVSARKYRPVRFEEVVGQEHVSQTLKNALKNDHLAHAFLFCGPRGVGKTTCARILAKVLNCQNVGADYEPCNECESCRAFNENASFNITELDAASNNSVEHIRALIEQVRFRPQQGKYKVFIIDEVHMLSQQAFNAFLKTLEEPPPYAIFILATTEKHKIIPTILSRCQIFDFKRIQVKQMVLHLQEICQTEGITAEPEALHIIGQKADGALRDALSIFDRIVAFSGKEIKYQDVIENLNVLDYDFYFKVVDALLVEDLTRILLIFDDILKKGFDGDIFINGLAEHLRSLLICKDEQTLQLLERSDDLKARYLEQARKSPLRLLLTALNLCNDCDINYRMARNKRLHVEMALIKMTHILRAVTHTPDAITAEATSEKKILVESKSSQENVNATPLPPTPKEEVVTPMVVAETKTAPVQEPEKEQPEVHPTEKVEEQPVSSVAEAVPPIENKPKPIAGGAKKFSLAKVDLGTMLAAAKEGHQEEEKKERILTEEGLQLAWNAYLETVEQMTIKTTLKQTSLTLEEQNIVATVTSNLAENTLRQERSLMAFLRSELECKDLSLSIIVDKSAAPEVPKKKAPLTAKQKYVKMVEINPNVSEIQKRFGLRPDET